MSITVLSLGAGVQSTTLALMASHGEVPIPDCAIFADTGWEPREVYDHLDEVDLRTHAERGQPDLFGNECEGMCGV